jgi:hypothetical protein
MKKISLCTLFAAVLLLAAATAFAAPPPQADFLASLSAGQDTAQAPAVSTPARSARAEDTCNPPIYSCQSCPSSAAPLKLCYEKVCGTFVIVHCDPCAPTCILPPA